MVKQKIPEGAASLPIPRLQKRLENLQNRHEVAVLRQLQAAEIYAKTNDEMMKALLARVHASESKSKKAKRVARVKSPITQQRKHRFSELSHPNFTHTVENSGFHRTPHQSFLFGPTDMGSANMHFFKNVKDSSVLQHSDSDGILNAQGSSAQQCTPSIFNVQAGQKKEPVFPPPSDVDVMGGPQKSHSSTLSSSVGPSETSNIGSFTVYDQQSPYIAGRSDNRYSVPYTTSCYSDRQSFSDLQIFGCCTPYAETTVRPYEMTSSSQTCWYPDSSSHCWSAPTSVPARSCYNEIAVNQCCSFPNAQYDQSYIQFDAAQLPRHQALSKVSESDQFADSGSYPLQSNGPDVTYPQPERGPPNVCMYESRNPILSLTYPSDPRFRVHRQLKTPEHQFSHPTSDFPSFTDLPCRTYGAAAIDPHNYAPISSLQPAYYAQ